MLANYMEKVNKVIVPRSSKFVVVAVNWSRRYFSVCVCVLVTNIFTVANIHYTSNSFNLHLLFTKMLGYKKFCVSSSSSFVGDVGEPDRDGPLMESVGSAVNSFLGVFFVLAVGNFNDDGSAWHSTNSIFSRIGEFLSRSSLSQSLLFDGFSEKRRC
jgi:hypothetical protein